VTDLPTIAFFQLRQQFFDATGEPIPFVLRDKLNTQDDPFDEFLATSVLASLDGVLCAKASGPLITPDMVLYRSDGHESMAPSEIPDGLDRIIGIEVKKLNRSTQGKVARASGLDYNTTPPCGRVRVYDASVRVVDIRAFYLFVYLEKAQAPVDGVMVTALCLVDGNALNEDFDLYLRITGQREKRIGLGTYGDGADRERPMLIFANPLGAVEFDHAATLIHPEADLSRGNPELQLAYRLHRHVLDNGTRTFHCYRVRADLSEDWQFSDLYDPFPMPLTRGAQTAPRGRFRLPFRI
jgi:hypothetical protein